MSLLKSPNSCINYRTKTQVSHHGLCLPLWPHFIPLFPQSHQPLWTSFLPSIQHFKLIPASWPLPLLFYQPGQSLSFNVTSQGRPSRPFCLKQHPDKFPIPAGSLLSLHGIWIYLHLIVSMIIVCLHSLKWRLQKNSKVILFTPPSLAPRIHLAQRKYSEICGWLINKWISVVLHGTRFFGRYWVMDNWSRHSPAFPTPLHYESFLTKELTLLYLLLSFTSTLGYYAPLMDMIWRVPRYPSYFRVHSQLSSAGVDGLVRRAFRVNESRRLEVALFWALHPLRCSPEVVRIREFLDLKSLASLWLKAQKILILVRCQSWGKRGHVCWVSGESITMGLSCPKPGNQLPRISTETALDQECSHGYLPKRSSVFVLQQSDIYILLVLHNCVPL